MSENQNLNNPGAPQPPNGSTSNAGSQTSSSTTSTPTTAPTSSSSATSASEASSTANIQASEPSPSTVPTLAEGEVSKSLNKIAREARAKEAMEKAQKMGMNYIDLSVTPINPDLLKIISPEDAQKGLIIPFYRLGKKLRVTVVHPTDPETRNIINNLKNQGYLINTNISAVDDLEDALKLYQTDQYIVKKQIDTHFDESKIQTYEKEIANMSELADKLKHINSEEGTYLICQSALKAGSSDIHLETEENFVRARFRIDGLLHEVFRIDKTTFENLANQFKYQCKMRLNVNNVPQDGRFFFEVNNRKIDVRVSVLPTEYGETFVMRLLDSGRHLVSFEELGYSGQYLAKIERLTKISHGMVLMTGPTGSGKTTSLYTMLSKFNKPDAKIITLEDPIEYHLEGISQSQIQEKHGYTFASGLRAILRQDPEVIMIGEIRDKETAETAAQAALTGHVLLSTLHTNSAIETIPRLINIGLPPFMVAPALHAIIAQRLARKICPHCQVNKAIPKSTYDEIAQVVESIKKIRPSEDLTIPAELPEAPGCDQCSHSGYKGRVCLVEMLEVDFEMKDLILNKASTTKMIESARRKGMITMREDGIIKVIKGITTLEEVHRVTTIA